MRVILHIGANKTGTSSLQKWFRSNRDQLLKQGILWPQFGLAKDAHYGLSRMLGFSDQGPALEGAELEAARDQLLEEVESSDASVVLFSSEQFMLKRKLDPALRFFRDFDLEIVVALRRHDDWWPSLWSQAIKSVSLPPWGSSFESFLAFQMKFGQQHFDYQRLIETWEGGFPGKVRAFAYEAQQMPNGILARFLSATGLEVLNAPLAAGERRVNQSPRVDVLALVDLIQRSKVLAVEEKGQFISRVLKFDSAAVGPGDLISARTRLQLIEPHGDDYAYLGKRFGLSDGMFFRDPLPADDGRDGPHDLPFQEALALLLRQRLSA